MARCAMAVRRHGAARMCLGMSAVAVVGPLLANVGCLLISSLVGRLRMFTFHAKRCLLGLAWCFALLSGLVLDGGVTRQVELLQSEREGV